MTVSNRHQIITLISRDPALTALLTGYCVGKHMQLHTLSGSAEIQHGMLASACELIILDSHTAIIDTVDGINQALSELAYSVTCPLLIIYRDRKPKMSESPAHLHLVDERDILLELDNHLRDQDRDKPSPERRVGERRQLADRRSLRRNGLNGRSQHPYTVRVGDFEVNHLTKSVHRDGRDLHLTRKEFQLFTLLMSEREEVCSIDSIVQRLWPDTKRANKSDLYQYIHTLRKKLEPNPCDPKCLVTVKGVGYQLQL